VRKAAQIKPSWRKDLKPEEVKKLEAYFKRTFNQAIVIKPRPKKDESAEVYLGDEFLGVVFRDEEDGELSYNFSMAILDIDL
jgi:hypothetical protein